MPSFRFRQGRIDGREDQAGAGRAQQGDDELQVVRADQADRPVRVQARVQQPLGQFVGQGSEGPVRHRLAGLAEDECRRVRPVPDLSVDHVVQAADLWRPVAARMRVARADCERHTHS
ncbi:hypothetical protein SCANM63S_07292 [Streptomyces canarius]